MANFELENLALKYCEQHGIPEDEDRFVDVITAFRISALIEREACAKICSEWSGDGWLIARAIGQEISARGK